MIKRLKVKNFRSLKDFEIEFGKFNVLIGRNNTGKSNIIDVLNFIREGFTDMIGRIFARRGGYKEVVFGGDEENDIEIEVEFETNFLNSNYNFVYNVQISNELVVKETLKITKNNEFVGEIPDLRWFGNPPYICMEKNPDVKRIQTLIKSCEIEKKFKTMDNGIDRGAIFGMLVCKIHIYSIIPQNIKPEYPEAFVDKYLTLDEDCKNLALFLLKLSQQDKKKFERIKELLSGIIDEIEDISPTIEGKRIYLMMKDKNFDKYFYAESISDGTISLLSYISIIETSEKPDIICFEEPENFIHARLLEFLVDLFRRSDAQIILTTHSLQLINLCEPEDMIMVEKENGGTKARRIENREEFKKFLDENELTLGELYYSSELQNE